MLNCSFTFFYTRNNSRIDRCYNLDQEINKLTSNSIYCALSSLLIFFYLIINFPIHILNLISYSYSYYYYYLQNLLYPNEANTLFYYSIIRIPFLQLDRGERKKNYFSSSFDFFVSFLLRFFDLFVIFRCQLHV